MAPPVPDEHKPSSSTQRSPVDRAAGTSTRWGDLLKPATDPGGTYVPPRAREAFEVDPGLSQMLVDRDQYFEQQDHAASVARTRRVLPLAAVLWIGFFAVDVVLATFVVPTAILPFVVLRLVGLVPILAVWVRLKKGPSPSPRELTLLDLIMTSSSSGLLTGMVLISGGLTSPYNSYIPLVLMGRAATLPNHWKKGAVALGVPALLNPVVLGVAAVFSPTVAAQFLDAAARGTFFFWLMLIGGAWLLLVIGGHNVWALRRQVFQSRSIGSYRLKSRIGRGGMGEVWVAYHDQLKRNVALKILRPDFGTDQTAIARFEREIMATAALSHPNTVRIYDHGVTEDGLWYYAMELLEGSDLASAVRASGPMSAGRALHVVGQAARALAEAHARGIIHRDVKPENVFITTQGGEVDFVKVLDFGIVKFDRDADGNLTTTGSVAGTPAYVSPEAAAGKSVDTRADVYGLGCTLYYALTGTPPFIADNARLLFYKHFKEPPQPPSTRLGAAVPADLENIIMRCLAKRPHLRYADASELVAVLEACSDAGSWRPARP